MDKILAGVDRFRRNVYPAKQLFFEQLEAKPQEPIALFITCSDSRIDPNLITQTDPGELFVIRNAGNFVPPHGSPIGSDTATVEYSVEVLKIRNIILCGHSQWGATRTLRGRAVCVNKGGV
ncbi:MAG: carbonic anhydrase, partial [Pirellulaceae bacterium]